MSIAKRNTLLDSPIFLSLHPIFASSTQNDNVWSFKWILDVFQREKVNQMFTTTSFMPTIPIYFYYFVKRSYKNQTTEMWLCRNYLLRG